MPECGAAHNKTINETGINSDTDEAACSAYEATIEADESSHGGAYKETVSGSDEKTNRQAHPGSNKKADDETEESTNSQTHTNKHAIACTRNETDQTP